MKKYFLYFVIVLFTWSCGDSFLESEPMTQKSEQNYYKTPQDAWETLVGCYQRMRGSYGDFFQSLNVSADECFAGGGKGDDLGSQIWSDFKIYAADLERNTYTWNARNFTAIRRCTVLTEVLDGIEWGSQAHLRDRYEAEARFLRAYFTFLLQSTFGHIPLNRTSTEKNTAQTDPHDVYRFIVEDLLYAINHLPNQKFGEVPDEFGRATKWAAMAYLGRVYLFYSGYYADPRVAAHFGGVQDIGVSKAEVLNYLETLISDSGHALVPRFGSLWHFSKREDYHKDPTLTYAGEYNPEIIFCIKHSANSSYSNSHPQYFGLRGVPSPGAYNPFWVGYGMATIHPKAFEQYEPGDERRFASIIDVATEYPDPFLQERLAVDQRDYTGYFQKKWQTLTASPTDIGNSDPFGNHGATGQAQSYQDLILMRHADVLLMAAELGSSNAMDYVNQIRDRAFNDQTHRVSSVDIDVIYAERSREFVCEARRYHDLLRRGLDYAKQHLDCYLTADKIQNAITGGDKEVIFPIESLGLFRIPESQINISEGKLIQNPYWINN